MHNGAAKSFAKFLGMLLVSLLVLPTSLAVAVQQDAIELESSATPAVSSGSAGGATKVVAGEPVDVSMTATFTQPVHQRAFVRPDGSVDHATFLHFSTQLEDMHSYQLAVNGQPVELVEGTEPQAGQWVRHNKDGVIRIYAPLSEPEANSEGAEPSAEAAVPGLEQGGTVTFDARMRVPEDAEAGSALDSLRFYASMSDGASSISSSEQRMQVEVVDPQLTISKLSNPGSAVTRGAEVDYELRVGAVDSTVYEVTISDELPEYVELVDAGEGSLSDGVLTFSAPKIVPGEEQVFTYRVKVVGDENASHVTVTNKAVAKGFTLPQDVVDQGGARSEVGPVEADNSLAVAGTSPTITKQVDIPKVADGQTVHYTIDVQVPAQTPLFNVTITDTLPEGLEFVDDVTFGVVEGTAASPVVADPLTTHTNDLGATSVGWYLGTIDPAPTPVTYRLTYPAKVTGQAGQTLTNTARFGAYPVDTLGGALPDTRRLPDFTLNSEASADVTLGAAKLAITGTVETDYWVPSRDGDDYTLEYKLTVRNDGDMAADDVVVALDSVGEWYRFYNTHEFSDASGVEGGSTATIARIEPGQSVELTAHIGGKQVGMTPEYEEILQVVGRIYEYKEAGQERLSQPSTDQESVKQIDSNVMVTKVAHPDLGASKQVVGATTVASGDVVDFQATFTNTGEAPIYELRLRDTPPRQWELVDDSVTITVAGQPVEFSKTGTRNVEFKLDSGSLRPGESGEFRASFRVPEGQEVGPRTNQLYVYGNDTFGAYGTPYGSFSAYAQARLTVGAVDLSITKTPQEERPGTVVQSGAGQYTVTVRNSGNVEARGVRVVDQLPAHLSLDRDAFPGEVPELTVNGTDAEVEMRELTAAPATASDGERVTWEIPVLPAGAVVTFPVPVKHDGSAAEIGSLYRNTATIQHGRFEASAEGWLELISAMKQVEVAKSVNVPEAAVGEEVTFTIDVTVPAHAAAQYDVTIIDQLPRGMSVVEQGQLTHVSGPELNLSDGGVITALERESLGSTDLGWYLGDLTTPLDEPAVYRATVVAKIDETFGGTSRTLVPLPGARVSEVNLAKSDGLLVNTVQPWFSTTDGEALTAVPEHRTDVFDRRGPSSAAGVRPLAPHFRIDKKAKYSNVGPSSENTYTVEVSNVGNVTATDVNIVDDLGHGGEMPGLTDVTEIMASVGSAQVNGDALTWLIDALPAGESATLTYVATSPNSADLIPFNSVRPQSAAAVLNTAKVDTFGAEGTDVTYTDSVSATQITYVATPTASYPSGSMQCGAMPAGSTTTLHYSVNFGDTTEGRALKDQSAGRAIDVVGNIKLPRNFQPATVNDEPAEQYIVGGTEEAGYELAVPLGDVARGRGSTFTVAGEVTADIEEKSMSSSMEFTWKDTSGNSKRGENSGFIYDYSVSSSLTCGSSTAPSVWKSHDGPDVVDVKDDPTITWRMNWHDRAAGAQGDFTITDSLPVGIVYEPKTAVIEARTGGGDWAPIEYDETVEQDEHHGKSYQRVTWTIADQEPNSAVRVTMPTTLADDVPLNQRLTNEVRVSYGSLSHSTCGYGDRALCATDSVQVIDGGELQVTKSGTPAEAVFGSTHTFDVDFTVPASERPVTLEFRDHMEADWNPGRPGAPRDWSLASEPTLTCVDCAPDEQLDITLSLGSKRYPQSWEDFKIYMYPGSDIWGEVKDLAPSSQPRTFRLTYQVASRELDEVTPYVRPATLTNDVISWLTVDGTRQPNVYTRAKVNAVAGKVEPSKVCTPDVTAFSAAGEANVECTITATNVGTVPVQGFTLVDLLPTEATWKLDYQNLETTAVSATVVSAEGSPVISDNTITWDIIEELQPGESRDYKVKLAVTGDAPNVPSEHPVSYMNPMSQAMLRARTSGEATNWAEVRGWMYKSPSGNEIEVSLGDKPNWPFRAFDQFGLSLPETNIERGWYFPDWKGQLATTLYTSADNETRYHGGGTDQSGLSVYREALNIAYQDPLKYPFGAGDTLKAGIILEANSPELVNNIRINDVLPKGFSYVPGSSQLFVQTRSPNWFYFGDDHRVKVNPGLVNLPDPTISGDPQVDAVETYTDLADATKAHNTGGQRLSWEIDRSVFDSLPKVENRTSALTAVLVFDVNTDEALANSVGSDSWTLQNYWSDTYAKNPSYTLTDPENKYKFEGLAGHLAATGFTAQTSVEFEMIAGSRVHNTQATVATMRTMKVSKEPDDGYVAAGGADGFDISVAFHHPHIPRMVITDTITGPGKYEPGTATVSVPDTATSSDLWFEYLRPFDPPISLTETIVEQTDDSVTIQWEIDATRMVSYHMQEDHENPDGPRTYELIPNEVKIHVPFTVPDDVQDGTQIANSVRVQADRSRQVGDVWGPPEQNYGSSMVTNDYAVTGIPPQEASDSARFTVVNPSPPPAVGIDTPDLLAPGQKGTVNVTVPLSENKVWSNLYVTATIPAGMTVESLGDPACSGDTCKKLADTTRAWDVITNDDGTTTIGWWLGNVEASPQIRDVTLPVNVRISDGDQASSLNDGDRLTVKTHAYSEDVVKEDTMPDEIPTEHPTAFKPAVATAITVIGEPSLTIAKSVVGDGPYSTGDQVDYLLEVTNTGRTTAYGTSVQDAPDYYLTDVKITDMNSETVLVKGWTADAPTFGLWIESIAPGQTATVRYSGTVRGGYEEEAEAKTQLDNTAKINGFASQPAPMPTGSKWYPSNEFAEAHAPLDAPGLQLTKTAGTQCDMPAGMVSPDGRMTWCLTASSVGSQNIYDLTISDLLPDEWVADLDGVEMTAPYTEERGEFTPLAGVAQDGRELTFPVIDELASGQSVTIRFETQAPALAATSGFNEASATAISRNGKATVRAQAKAPYLYPDAELSILKTPLEQTFAFAPSDGGAAGTKVTWDVLVVNTSGRDQHNVNVVDTLPGENGVGKLTLSDWSAESSTGVEGIALADPQAAAAQDQGDGAELGRDRVVWTIDTLPADGYVKFTVVTTIGQITSDGHTLEWSNDVEAFSDEVFSPVINQAMLTLKRSSAITNIVWHDVNADGIRDDAEVGIPGALVCLADGDGVQARDFDGNPVECVTTGADGTYEFTNLLGGDYSVTVHPGDGWYDSPLRVGDDPTRDSDGRDIAIDGVPNGVIVSGYDTGLFRPGALSGLAWFDADANGLQDDGEERVAGIRVTLLDADGEPAVDVNGNPVAPAVTAEDGTYLFGNLRPGQYSVTFALADGMTYEWTTRLVGDDRTRDSDGPNSDPAAVVSDKETTDIDVGVVVAPEPTPDPDPTPDPTPTPSPTPTPGGDLPWTGASVAGLMAVAVALLLLGGVAVRRRHLVEATDEVE
ncbi:isopeptide-forming domain-containing fimbrial protein [Trueperella bialowiezensis]|uniref:Serine-aspartate repeat-containing protein F n=1 Tax=Trueperella bialowiezensis TaxID=312285 RepID=A0A3S4V6Z7_9ACTO|nr:isopeptide-forming domain-containing fimbrial protein [Trueperella bialowiezensis]VEI13408.1 Serine-aspartate repeat-containing protein F precursor [Trueperella bialowiezensis]